MLASVSRSWTADNNFKPLANKVIEMDLVNSRLVNWLGESPQSKDRNIMTLLKHLKLVQSNFYIKFSRKHSKGITIYLLIKKSVFQEHGKFNRTQSPADV